VRQSPSPWFEKRPAANSNEARFHRSETILIFPLHNLRVSIDWPQDIRDKLTPLSNKTKSFRRDILGGRNKREDKT
jgi:hypothetical protein